MMNRRTSRIFRDARLFSGRSSLSEGNFKSVRALNAAKRYMETHSSHPASRGTGSSAASVSSSTTLKCFKSIGGITPLSI